MADRNLTESDVEAVAEKVAEILGASPATATAVVHDVATGIPDADKFVTKVDTVPGTPAVPAVPATPGTPAVPAVPEKVDPISDFFSRFRLQATTDATDSIKSWLFDHFGIRI